MASPSVAAVIRQEQKDAFYVDWLRSRVSELALHAAGARLWAQLQAEQRLIADLAYYALTTARGLQTLGEEYVGLVQASAASIGERPASPQQRRRRLLQAPTLRAPGAVARLAAVALRVLAPYCGGKLLALWRRRVSALDDPRKDRLLDALELMCEMAHVAGRLHQMLFLIEGVYCALSSRLAGVRYVTTRRRQQSAPDAVAAEDRLRLLGCLGVAQSAFLLAQGAVRLYRCLSTTPPQLAGERMSSAPPPLVVHFRQDVAASVQRRSKCCFCLEPVKDATASPCGHLFCWSCIHSGCRAALRPECPVCREPLAAGRLVYLQNY